MNNSSSALLEQIDRLGLVKPALEISHFGNLNFVSAFKKRPLGLMANDACAGVDTDPELAITKAIVEFYERAVFQEGILEGHSVCERIHSDGIAAFPSFLENSKKQARNNAYLEAAERFVWANWWDDSEIGHKLTQVESSEECYDTSITGALEKFRGFCDVEELFLVEPFSNSADLNVQILFAKVRDLGFISGGAAGWRGEEENTFVRGLSEMIRHGIALKRSLTDLSIAQTFYEKRLLFFGLGHGNQMVLDRLNRANRNEVKLPQLQIDEEIPTRNFSELVYVHRCLFENQPPFVDGDLERLCL